MVAVVVVVMEVTLVAMMWTSMGGVVVSWSRGAIDRIDAVPFDNALDLFFVSD